MVKKKKGKIEDKGKKGKSLDNLSSSNNLKEEVLEYRRHDLLLSKQDKERYKELDHFLSLPEKTTRKPNVYRTVVVQGEPLSFKESLSKTRRELTYNRNALRGGKDLTVHILEAASANIIKDIQHEYYINKADVIVFDDILPLVNNTKFLDLIVEEGILFTSIENSNFAEPFSKSLKYLADKLDAQKGGNRNAGKLNKKLADKLSMEVGPLLQELHGQGFKSLQSKANELNAKKIKTLRGNDWSRMAVKRHWERWQKLKAEEESNPNSSSAITPKP